MIKRVIFLILILVNFSSSIAATTACVGHFINPITDISWDSIFPLTIGATPVVPSPLGLPDTENPVMPIVVCQMPPPIFERIGMTMGYWEPYALTDITRSPYCMVNMGFQMSMGFNEQQLGGNSTGLNPDMPNQSQFYHVHWYKYPVIYWLQLIDSSACMSTDNFDISYFSEIDPLWDDDTAAFIMNPEAILFGNPIAQLSCISESIATSTNMSLPFDPLFWCAGSQGSMYPLTGHVSHNYSDVSNAALVTERMNFKLHREGLIMETVGEWPAVCYQYYTPILPKSRYRYQWSNVVPEPYISHPYGTTTMISEAGRDNVATADNYGLVNFRKRNCVFI
ncbi:conjugal transfer pilus assembly protein TraU [Thiotrichales bacterium 19S11-10]|nr:conjugal transfer pilus assembly protein TraU [Thiotrichales bacterium 19S11-10]